MSARDLAFLARRHLDAAILARETGWRDHARMHMRLRARALRRLRSLNPHKKGTR